MAREFSFKALLNFSFADHAEMTSTRTAALNFASTQGGTAKISTLEDETNEDIPYSGKVELTLPVSSRAEVAGLMSDIDNALGSLPDLVLVNGKKLSYDFDESEDLVVNVYLNGEYQGNASYCCDWRKHEWFWTGWALGNYILKITVEDSQGEIVRAEMKVLNFCFLP